MGILVIGSVALDTITTPFGSIEEGLGGSATHFSVAASYFTDVHIVAVVGQDFPSRHLAMLEGKKIDISGIEKASGKTFRWAGKYDYDLNRAQTLKTELNVFESFNPKIPSRLKALPFVFLANIDPTLQEKVIGQVQSPKLIAADTMNFWIEGKREALLKILSRVDLLSINESEARLLAREPSLYKAAQIIRGMGPKTLVIKQGEYGALLFHENLMFSAPGLPLEDIKDPTGAGDSFAGGFMGYLAKKGGMDFSVLKQAVIVGSVMASYNVSSFGCERLQNLNDVDIQERYEEFRRLSHFEEINW